MIRREDGVVVKNTAAFQQLWGSKSIPQDVTSAKKIAGGQIFVSWEDLNKRLEDLRKKKRQTQLAINFIEKLVEDKE